MAVKIITSKKIEQQKDLLAKLHLVMNNFIKHPNVIPIVSAYSWKDSMNFFVYIVMPLGESLAQRIKSSKKNK